MQKLQSMPIAQRRFIWLTFFVGGLLLLVALFVLLSLQVGTRRTAEGDMMQPEKRLFAYSIAYLFLLFGAVVADHWWPL